MAPDNVGWLHVTYLNIDNKGVKQYCGCDIITHCENTQVLKYIYL